jgi:hypothetical protein
MVALCPLLFAVELLPTVRVAGALKVALSCPWSLRGWAAAWNKQSMQQWDRNTECLEASRRAPPAVRAPLAAW